jgi:hypothetical protein
VSPTGTTLAHYPPILVVLLLNFGLRKGALQGVQFKHFDHYRKRLTVFTKGERVREVPIPDPSFWDELGRLIVEEEARPDHYLLSRQKAIPKGAGARRRSVMHRFPDKPMGGHGLHTWWYRCLARGVVPEGTTRGERMHKARHTAGSASARQDREPESFPTRIAESPARRGFHGGGGNRTRVRDRTGMSVYKLRLRLHLARTAGSQPTNRRASHPSVSRRRRLALPWRRARF